MILRSINLPWQFWFDVSNWGHFPNCFLLPVHSWYCGWCKILTLQPGRAHSWQPGRQAAWRARQLERRDRGRRSNLASDPGTKEEEIKREVVNGEIETDSERQIDREVHWDTEEGVMSQQSVNFPFAPQEGSGIHWTLIASLQSFDTLMLQSINVSPYHNACCWRTLGFPPKPH